MKQDIIRLFDSYTHSTMPRRSFLRKLILATGSVAAAKTMLPLLEGRSVMADQIPENDPHLITADESFMSGDTEMKVYVARPADGGKYPAVVVIHQNRGLTPHIRDVARKMALQGFVAIAPDALSPLGGAPEGQDKGRLLMRDLDRDHTLMNFVDAVSYADQHPFSTGKVGCMGFCWGGSMSGQLSFRAAALDAAVIYYGGPPADEDVAKIHVPLMMHYAGLDERINARIPAFTDALKSHQKDYTMFIYEGANHAFNDDTRPARYDQAASDKAYERTIGFFKSHLK